jgi:mRNA interferase MazF
MTTGSRPAPFRIPASRGGKDGLVLLEQLRAVDKERLVKRFGVLDTATLEKTLRVLQEVFAR